MPVLNSLEHGTRCVVTTRYGRIVSGRFRGIEIAHGDRSILIESNGYTHSIPVESVFAASNPDRRNPPDRVGRIHATLRKEPDVINKLHVGNLTFDTTPADLQTLFAKQGEVKEATVVADRHSGRSRGFGFVEMGSPEEAKTAIGALDGHNLDGRDLTVALAKPRSR